jgi:hypothetical protein
MRPLIVRQITRVTKLVAAVTVFGRPRQASRESVPIIESQEIQCVQAP